MAEVNSSLPSQESPAILSLVNEINAICGEKPVGVPETMALFDIIHLEVEEENLMSARKTLNERTEQQATAVELSLLRRAELNTVLIEQRIATRRSELPGYDNSFDRIYEIKCNLEDTFKEENKELPDYAARTQLSEIWANISSKSSQ
jgi:hypothetical protein